MNHMTLYERLHDTTSLARVTRPTACMQPIGRIWRRSMHRAKRMLAGAANLERFQFCTRMMYFEPGAHDPGMEMNCGRLACSSRVLMAQLLLRDDRLDRIAQVC